MIADTSSTTSPATAAGRCHGRHPRSGAAARIDASVVVRGVDAQRRRPRPRLARPGTRCPRSSTDCSPSTAPGPTSLPGSRAEFAPTTAPRPDQHRGDDDPAVLHPPGLQVRAVAHGGAVPDLSIAGSEMSPVAICVRRPTRAPSSRRYGPKRRPAQHRQRESPSRMPRPTAAGRSVPRAGSGPAGCPRPEVARARAAGSSARPGSSPCRPRGSGRARRSRPHRR